jgi:hypothetical protein
MRASARLSVESDIKTNRPAHLETCGQSTHLLSITLAANKRVARVRCRRRSVGGPRMTSIQTKRTIRRPALARVAEGHVLKPL